MSKNGETKLPRPTVKQLKLMRACPIMFGDLPFRDWQSMRVLLRDGLAFKGEDAFELTPLGRALAGVDGWLVA